MDLFEGLVSYSLGKLEESLLSGGCLSLPVETVIHSATPYFYLRKKLISLKIILMEESSPICLLLTTTRIVGLVFFMLNLLV